jgi:hypothetical protein
MSAERRWASTSMRIARAALLAVLTAAGCGGSEDERVELFAVAASSTIIDLTLKAEQDVWGYDVYETKPRPSKFYADDYENRSHDSHTYRLIGLTPNTEYCFYAVVYPSGNQSNTACATTFPE